MNYETTNRLFQLFKNAAIPQMDIADKLGIGRQTFAGMDGKISRANEFVSAMITSKKEY